MLDALLRTTFSSVAATSLARASSTPSCAVGNKEEGDRPLRPKGEGEAEEGEAEGAVVVAAVATHSDAEAKPQQWQSAQAKAPSRGHMKWADVVRISDAHTVQQQHDDAYRIWDAEFDSNKL